MSGVATTDQAAAASMKEYPFASVPKDEALERYRQIAADRPMTRMTMPYGGDAWVVHRTAAARQMLGDPRFVRRPFREGERVVPYFMDFPEFLKSTIQFQDPPEHTKLRRLVQRAISPKSVKAMRDSAIEFANRLIDAMLGHGGPTNFVQNYALPLPIQMLSNLLGVPPEDHEKFERWSSATLAVAGMHPDEADVNMRELTGYMATLIEARRTDPKDDLISLLANAQEKDDTLRDEEILSIALILIVGGFDNTANFITFGTISLLNNDDQRRLFLTDPDGFAPTAVEEVLREGRLHMGMPVTGVGGLVPFVATEDVVIDGQLVAAGEAILFDPVSANHDGIALPDAHRFDITRENNPHLTLSYGLHYCLGASLARMEMQVALAELFKRLPTLRLAGPPVVDHDVLVRPVTDLQVVW